MNLAPIILFVYNRPWHTQQTLDALAKNKLAKNSVLYIYADGAKENATEQDLQKINEVREVISTFQGCKETCIVERDRNWGLADNIVDGVTKIVNQYEKIIVLEDDIVTSKDFLQYMNKALDLYKNEEQVMHISGYMFPINKTLQNSFFMNVTMCWGWATWKSAWKHYNKNTDYLINEIKKTKRWEEFNVFPFLYLKEQLELNQSGKLHTWFIKWNASVFLKNGFTLFPSVSLVNNIGFDNTGENSILYTEFENYLVKDYELQEEKANIKLNHNLIQECNNHYQPKIEKQRMLEKLKKYIKNNVLFKKISEIIDRKINNKINAIIIENTNFTKTTVFESGCIVKNSTLKDQVQIKKGAYLHNVVLQDYVCIYNNAEISNTKVGYASYIGVSSKVHNTNIGKYCSIAPHVISGLGEHPINFISTYPSFYSTLKYNNIDPADKKYFEEYQPIEIGHDVWIGVRSIILDGVKIGTGSIIAAGAVVVEDVDPYTIVGGVPAKIIKKRFPQDIIEYLLATKWWNLNIEEIQKIRPIFQKPIQSIEQLKPYFEEYENID